MSTASAATVLVIDDHPLFRKGVLQLLASAKTLTPVGEAENGEAGIEKALALEPDLILLDLNMKGRLDGIATLEQLRARGVESRIVILTVSDDANDLVAAIRAGADGYLLKDTEPETMLRQLESALFGQTVISDGLASLLATALRQESAVETRSRADLTERETMILACLAQGLSNKLIARELDIMESTVKVHIRNLLKKLKFHSRLEAAVWAVSNGMSGR
ncbi:MAG: two-component system response regulator NarL [Betaproteobacteria bacterium]|nr:two-component system response regulator NarL [Betaproteobacteria bacterium]MDE2354475.1 two-component system response regulator NarL [Betaproteobacteria bacterium]